MHELYKKYRPSSLEEIYGNKIAVQTLKNMIGRKTLPHTILLSGPSGCGKTTIARILRKELECKEFDFRELNCSDFRGVDTIREIARTMNIAASGKSRIFLLDEVHQLTKDAQNAALKILEDTPKHVYFLLATTDPQKIIPTIKTRCCEIRVEALNQDDSVKLIKDILKKEKETLDDSIIMDIIDTCNGSPRKILVTLERVLNVPKNERKNAVQEEDVQKEVLELCRALMKGESWSKISKILKDLKEEPESIRYAVLGYARSCLLNSSTNNQAALIIEAFQNNFYDSKEAGLALACYTIIVGIN